MGKTLIIFSDTTPPDIINGITINDDLSFLCVYKNTMEVTGDIAVQLLEYYREFQSQNYISWYVPSLDHMPISAKSFTEIEVEDIGKLVPIETQRIIFVTDAKQNNFVAYQTITRCLLTMLDIHLFVLHSSKGDENEKYIQNINSMCWLGVYLHRIIPNYNLIDTEQIFLKQKEDAVDKINKIIAIN